MTDRVRSLTVVLECDIRDDDAERLVRAILLLQGVVSVGMDIVDSIDYVYRSRIKSEIRKQLFGVLDND